MGDWWSVIKEPKKIPRARLFGKTYPRREMTPEMEEDIDAVVEQEEEDFSSKTKPKTKFLGGGLIRDGKTVKRYKRRN